jgi:hypothetical protein
VPPTNDLHTLDALATEHGQFLAFRACEDSDEFEPVFLQVGRAGVGAADGAADGAAMIAITDANGMSLGRYVISRKRLEAALGEAKRGSLSCPRAAAVQPRRKSA